GYHDAVLRQLIEYRRHPADLVRWYLDGELLERLQWREEGGSGQTFADHFPDGASFIEDLEWVERQLRISYFKRVQAAPLIVLSKRAFGTDLRETQWPEYSPRIYRQLKERVLTIS
ncbi:MAG: NAD(+) synthase, partial [Candidatus Latescibacterota bacterium]|nr:NAD(+) synthase [Candidatus Latescibacterota bacterium]